MANEDILFDAAVNDRTLEFFERFDSNLDRAATAAEQGFANVDRSVQTAGKSMGILGGIVGGLTVKLLDMGFAAVQSITGFVKGAIDLRARADTLGLSLEHVGKQAGYSAQEIAQAEEEVKSMGITTVSARQSLLRLTRANIDWSEASKLARIAQDSAVIAGINSSQAFDRLVRGIQKQEPELLDELGIQLRRTEAYERLADQLGKTTKELTDAERQQAILNEVYRQSEVVAGSYENAMGSVGKQMTSLPRLFEELQLAIGGAFQEALQAKVTFMTNKLKELNKWFEENEDSVKQFSHFLGTFATTLFTILEKLLQFLASLPGKIKNAGIELGVIIAKLFDIADEEQIREQGNNIGLYAKQFVSLIVTIFTLGAKGVLDAWQFAAAGVSEFLDVIKGEKSIKEAVNNLSALKTALKDDIINTAAEVNDQINEALGLVPQLTEDVEDLGEAAGDTGDEMEDAFASLREAAISADKAFSDLKKEIEDAAEVRAIKEMRDVIERELQESFQREDIERNFQERIAKIREDAEAKRTQALERYEEQRLQLADNYAEAKIRIERNYRRRLRDLERDFISDARELARRRQGAELLELQRRYEDEVAKAKQDKQDQEEDAAINYQDQLDSLKEAYEKQKQTVEDSLEEQIQAAEEARQKEYDALERSLDRQRQIRDLHAKWEEEDRERDYKKRLEKMGEEFAGLEGLTEEGLQAVLSKWEEHFGDLQILLNSYHAAIVQATTIPNIPGIPGLNGGVIGGGTPLQSPGYSTPGISNPGAGGSYMPLGQFIALLSTYTRNQLIEVVRQFGFVSDSNLSSLNSYTLEQLRQFIIAAYQRRLNQQGGPIGQAGQLSMPLATGLTGGSMITNNTIQQVQPVQPSTEKHTYLHVDADLRGVEPYLQRQVINTLVEIERNRSG